MTLKMKNRLQGYDKNKPRSRLGHKYTKYKICHSKMIVICIKQNLKQNQQNLKLNS